MKLGTQTGSVMNHLYARGTIGQPQPTVGMGATLLGWTDRDAATIVDVSKARNSVFVTVTRDKATLVSGSQQSESQGYEFTPRPDGCRYIFRQAKDGGWEEVRYNDESKRYVKTRGKGLRIGDRSHYRDPCF